jgi:hypothetical protein
LGPQFSNTVDINQSSRSTEPLAVCFGRCQAGTNTFSNQLPFELGNRCEDPENELSVRSRGVDAFVYGHELNAEGVELRQSASGKPVVTIDNDDVEEAFAAIT